MALGYEPPQLINLFTAECELARGRGTCGDGAQVGPNACSTGGIAGSSCGSGCDAGIFGCSAGTVNIDTIYAQCCTGTSVSRYNCVTGSTVANTCNTGVVPKVTCVGGACVAYGPCSSGS